LFEPVLDYEELLMRISLILFCLALLIVPSLSMPVNVGGTYGKNWLNNSGDKNIIPSSLGLWDWGETPLGYILMNGKLVSTGESGSTLIYPAFVTNSTPLIGNASLNAHQNDPRHLTLAQLASSYMYEDPWAVAQSTGQPILVQNSPYL
jgi:hypothetical protein